MHERIYKKFLKYLEKIVAVFHIFSSIAKTSAMHLSNVAIRLCVPDIYYHWLQTGERVELSFTVVTLRGLTASIHKDNINIPNQDRYNYLFFY